MGKSFNESLTRIRRRLRDTDKSIWSDDLLRVFWNDIQKELVRKLPQLLCRFEAYPAPQFVMDYSYTHNWEYRQIDPDRETWPCLVYDQTLRMVVTHVWESAYSIDAILYYFGEGSFGESEFGATVEGGTTDDGYRHTLWWEPGQVVTAEPMRIRLDRQFHRAKLVAYDGVMLDGLTETEVAEHHYYKTETGTPIYYYRPDDFSNDVIMYPRPAGPTFNEPGDRDDNHYAASEDWEIDDYYLVGPAYRPEYMHEQEPDGIYGTHGWEWNDHMTEVRFGPDDARVLERVNDVSEDIDTDDYFNIIYEFVPNDVPEEDAAWGEFLPYPEWAVKYLEYGTLERAYGADTDGFIPSLRDYWGVRYQVGIKVLERFIRRSIFSGRVNQLGGYTRKPGRVYPTLGHHYPSI